MYSLYQYNTVLSLHIFSSTFCGILWCHQPNDEEIKKSSGDSCCLLYRLVDESLVTGYDLWNWSLTPAGLLTASISDLLWGPPRIISSRNWRSRGQNVKLISYLHLVPYYSINLWSFTCHFSWPSWHTSVTEAGMSAASLSVILHMVCGTAGWMLVFFI
jgi:hypothetical protein